MVEARPDGQPRAAAARLAPQPLGRRHEGAVAPPGALAAAEPPREVANFCDPQAHRAQLWDLQRWLWKHAGIDRQRTCRHHAHGELVELRRRTIANGERANFSQLITCGLAWTCPMCGPKIAAERATDIALAISEHHARGGQIGFFTMTVRHSRAQSLVELLNGLTGAWTTVRQSKVPRRLWRALSSGWIKRLEVTLGENGWHPHLHLLVFLNPGTTQAQLDELAAAVTAAWGNSLERQGLGRIHSEHGVTAKLLDLSAAHEKVAEYVAKSAALELASPGTKTARKSSSRTPLQLLADLARDGLADDQARWREFERSMKGKSQIRWSQGLRADLLPDVDELTDQEAADSSDGLGRLLGALDRPTWKKLRSWGPGPAKVIELAEAPGTDAAAIQRVTAVLTQHELGTLLPPEILSG
jgi:hypothetical protein